MITLYVVLLLKSSAMIALQFLKCCTALFQTNFFLSLTFGTRNNFLSKHFLFTGVRMCTWLHPIIWLTHKWLRGHSHSAMGIFFAFAFLVWPQSRALYFESNGYFAIHTTSDKTMMAVSLYLVSLVWTERTELNSFTNIQQKRALKKLGFEHKQTNLRLLLQFI